MLPHTFWWLVCDAGAVFRLTILTTRDKITEPFRERLSAPWAGMSPARPYSGLRWQTFTLLTCNWCISLWYAAAVVALTRFTPDVWQYLAMALAISAVAAVAAER